MADNLDFLHEHIRDQSERHERSLVRMEEKIDQLESNILTRLTDIQTTVTARVDEVEDRIIISEKKIGQYEGCLKALMFLLTIGVAAMSAFLGCFKWRP